MEQKIKDAIERQTGKLNLFWTDDRIFYSENCKELTERIIREKRILEFENPNRVKVTYEYDFTPISTDDRIGRNDIVFLFLPDKRKSWLKVYCGGQRLTVVSSAKIADSLYDIVRNDVMALVKDVDYKDSGYDLWKEIWKDKKSIPCFVYSEPITSLLSKGGIVEIEFYDFLEEDKSKKCCLRLFDEKHYVYKYPMVAKGNSWLYVKAPNRFEVDVKDDNKDCIEPNQGNDAEVQSYTIHGDKARAVEIFNISVKVPRTLWCWYGALVLLGLAYIIAFAIIARNALCKGLTIKEFSPVYAQVGICIIAAIIATRGWLMNEETVLRKVSYIITFIAIIIVTLLVGVYSWFMLMK